MKVNKEKSTNWSHSIILYLYRRTGDENDGRERSPHPAPPQRGEDSMLNIFE